MINLRKKEGITLIALVITIIVMLILVAVTITMAVNGGLFGYAGKAVKDTKLAKQSEENWAILSENMITEELIEKYSPKQPSFRVQIPFAGDGQYENDFFDKGMTWSEWLDSNYSKESLVHIVTFGNNVPVDLRRKNTSLY